MISTTVQYLARDELYDIEKPYSADFEIEERKNIKRSNYILSTEPVSIHAIGSSDHFHLDTHGFCTINAKTSLSAHDALTQPEAAETAYFDEIEAILHDRFPEYSRFEGIEFVVRSLFAPLNVLEKDHLNTNYFTRSGNAMTDSPRMK